MAKKRSIKKVQLATLIVVGEGPCDKAFLAYMKSLYDVKETGQKVKLDAADGGHPDIMLKDMDRKYKHADYDKRVLFIDSDVEVTEVILARAKRLGIEIVQSRPLCLEGMLLDVLGSKVPRTSQACKEVLHPQLKGRPTLAQSYQELFPKDILDNTGKEAIVRMRKLLKN